MSTKTNKQRWDELQSRRTAKLERARYCSILTVPSVLPPQGWSESDGLHQPFSSTAGRGVLGMASRILSALLPLNDLPFFRFEMISGMEPTHEEQVYLDQLAYQVYNRLSGNNLRESIFMCLQHLIIAGDVLLIMEDDFTFRVIRVDQFVIVRKVNGDPEEIIFLEFKREDDTSTFMTSVSPQQGEMQGYKTIYNKVVWNEDGSVDLLRQDSEGNGVGESGPFTVSKFIPLRWNAVAGEHYSRSHVEANLGDIQTLEGYTEAHIQGQAAASAFWPAVSPAGVTDIDDLQVENGSWVSAREEDVFTITPGRDVKPQLDASFQAVEFMRRVIGEAFLLNSASIPSGDRVTATAVRMIGQELETVLGGAFSSIARSLLKPMIERAIFLMQDNVEIDPRLAQAFSGDDGKLSINIITGLQSLSRETDLTKLLQMGDMVRNLPEKAQERFKWEQFAESFVSNLGFRPDEWVVSDEELAEQQALEQQRATEAQAQSAAVGVASQAAAQDVEQTGGENVANMAQQLGVM